ncbi:hypothetical protein ACWGH3_15355 [Streptomyces sp. NPDC054884]|uniref:hypothetical protein n=1 Tax=Streptomyces sp. ME08-AFT2 TaxID=3028683 RepID=UPI0029AB9730|nr:hypothetical protein [Streptomyces sp. ME08-AFT2]MDX3314075.1 hypothetical protein [Streptomyces sp. ME08-AFT2]
MTAEHEGRAGLDALMAAIVDEPLPDESRADDAFMAEHRSATADLALLREQLGALADALTADPAAQAEQRADPAHRPGRFRRPRPPRASRLPSPSRPGPAARLRPLVLRAAGVAAAGAMVLGVGWGVVQVGHGVSDDADGKASAASDAGADGPGAKGTEDAGSPLGDPGYLVCTRLVVEGEVTDVRPLPGTTRERVTLRVTHAYRPAVGAPEAGFELEHDTDPLPAAGDHVLVALGRGSATPDVWAVGEADIAPERTALARALPETAGLTCDGTPPG